MPLPWVVSLLASPQRSPPPSQESVAAYSQSSFCLFSVEEQWGWQHRLSSDFTLRGRGVACTRVPQGTGC